ncbi:MAG: DUF6293 family protein [Halobaculum sp.]
MEVTRRVHVFLYAGEEDAPRIRRAADRLYPDLTYLLIDQRVTDDVESTLTAEGVDLDSVVECIDCDHRDMYEILGIVTTVADRERHADDEVFVNVSTGRRPASIGAALGAMDTSTEATAYIDHGDSEERPRHTEQTEELPEYPITSPSAQQVALLGVVEELTTETHEPNKSEVIDRAAELDMAFLADIDDPLSGTGANAAQHRLSAQFVDQLGPGTRYEYVDVRQPGRSKQLSVTDAGENALVAFQHKAADTLAELELDVDRLV